MPTAMLETYHQCDTPPPLDKLNVYRYFRTFSIDQSLKRLNFYFDKGWDRSKVVLKKKKNDEIKLNTLSIVGKTVKMG